MKKELKTHRGHGLGSLEDDVTILRQYMARFGWTQTRLAAEANISQKQISRVLNREQNLSAASTDRILDAVAAAEKRFREDKASQGDGPDKLPQLSPEAAARIRSRVNLSNTDSRNTTSKNLEMLVALAPPPRDPVKYADWKAKQLQAVSASADLGEAVKRIGDLEKELAELKSTSSIHEELLTNYKEMGSVYKAWVDRLQKQLRDAGITPTD